MAHFRAAAAILDAKTAIDALRDAGWEVYGMDDSLLAVDPIGVKRLGGRCLTDCADDDAVRRHTHDICVIDDSGGW